MRDLPEIHSWEIKAWFLNADISIYLPAAFQLTKSQIWEQEQRMIYLVIRYHTPPNNGRIFIYIEPGPEVLIHF